MDSSDALPTPSSINIDLHKISYSPSSVSSGASSIFSVDAASSQSSVASSACSSSLEIGWDADSVASVPCSEYHIARHATAPAICLSAVGAAVTHRATSPITTRTRTVGVPAEQRLNRRRTNRVDCSTTIPARLPPSLVRQSDRKVNFVDSLVDSAAQIVTVIWPLSDLSCRGVNSAALGTKGVLPLKMFIQETLRRSRSSYSTLQVALYYLILIKQHLPKLDFTMEQPEDSASMRALQCGRRMFLAALILASKYLQDKNYSARAWSKISGLTTLEINMNEMTFLGAINWRLHVSEPTFQRWSDIILKYTSTSSPSCAGAFSDAKKVNWTTVLEKLTPDLVRRTPTRRSLTV